MDSTIKIKFKMFFFPPETQEIFPSNNRETSFANKQSFNILFQFPLLLHIMYLYWNCVFVQQDKKLGVCVCVSLMRYVKKLIKIALLHDSI